MIPQAQRREQKLRSTTLQGLRTVIVTDREQSQQVLADAGKHNEQWLWYPDDDPPHSYLAGGSFCCSASPLRRGCHILRQRWLFSVIKQLLLLRSATTASLGVFPLAGPGPASYAGLQAKGQQAAVSASQWLPLESSTTMASNFCGSLMRLTRR